MKDLKNLVKLDKYQEKIDEISNNIIDLAYRHEEIEYKQKLARTQFDQAMVEFEKDKRKIHRTFIFVFIVLALLFASIVTLHIKNDEPIEPITTVVSETTTVKAVVPETTKPKKKEETTKVETTVAETTKPVTTKPVTTTVKATVPATTKPVTTTKAVTTTVAPVADKKSSSTKYYNIPLSKGLQDHVFTLGKKYGIDPKLIFAVIRKESNYKPSTMGDSGRSYGLMQVQKRYHTARMQKLGCTNLLDPYQNISVGVDYLAELLSGGRSVNYALMAYNMGPSKANNCIKQGIVTNYVHIVKAYMNELK